MNEYVAGMLTIILILLIKDLIDTVKRDIESRKFRKAWSKRISELLFLAQS